MIQKLLSYYNNYAAKAQKKVILEKQYAKLQLNEMDKYFDTVKTQYYHVNLSKVNGFSVKNYRKVLKYAQEKYFYPDGNVQDTINDYKEKIFNLRKQQKNNEQKTTNSTKNKQFNNKNKKFNKKNKIQQKKPKIKQKKQNSSKEEVSSSEEDQKYFSSEEKEFVLNKIHKTAINNMHVQHAQVNSAIGFGKDSVQLSLYDRWYLNHTDSNWSGYSTTAQQQLLQNLEKENIQKHNKNNNNDLTNPNFHPDNQRNSLLSLPALEATNQKDDVVIDEDRNVPLADLSKKKKKTIAEHSFTDEQNIHRTMEVCN